MYLVFTILKERVNQDLLSVFVAYQVSWRLTPPASQSHHGRHLEAEEVDGFYILYRPSVGRPPGFTSITVLHAAATR